MATYELKNTTPAQVSLKDDGSAIIVQGFTTGPVGVPASYKMIAGDNISVTIPDYANKTVSEVNTIVIAAVNDFIANKYPTT
jgi:hypothetical protein